MIKRIVRLSIADNKIDDFITNFNKHKTEIRDFNGCEHLELWQDGMDKNVFVTYSIWTSEKDLEKYRNSDLFKGIWKVTKTYFKDKPLAWSHNQIS